MPITPRRFRLAAAVSFALISLGACAQVDRLAVASDASPIVSMPLAQSSDNATTAAADKETATRPTTKTVPSEENRASALTAELFYEVLLGELTAQSGDLGTGFELLLDSAKKARDGEVYRRAVELALQGRSGDAALRAARAWKQSIPDSRDASRYELQILIALDRIEETVDPLRAIVTSTPLVEQAVLMSVITRTYSRASDRKLAVSVVERALDGARRSEATGALAWSAIGRLRENAGDESGALQALRESQRMAPNSEASVALAIDLLGSRQPLPEAIVARYLKQPDADPAIRMNYARALVEQRRYAEAGDALGALTAAQPDMAEGWLLLGSLQASARHDLAGEASLERYLELAPGVREASDRQRGQTQAYLQLSQIAERRNDYEAAAKWLDRVGNGADAAATQTRQAALLARQGKVEQAMALIRSLPDDKPEAIRLKLVAQVQVLREAKQFEMAYDLLFKAASEKPDDADLQYDLSMMAEKTGRFDEMEKLLRQSIKLKPDNANAYNALGYSLVNRNLRVAEGRDLIIKALELAPDDPFITDSLGWADFRLGNLQEAQKVLERAYNARPDAEIGVHLGEVVWVRGDKARAIDLFRQAAIADADNESLRETLKRLKVDL